MFIREKKNDKKNPKTETNQKERKKLKGDFVGTVK